MFGRKKRRHGRAATRPSTRQPRRCRRPRSSTGDRPRSSPPSAPYAGAPRPARSAGGRARARDVAGARRLRRPCGRRSASAGRPPTVEHGPPTTARRQRGPARCGPDARRPSIGASAVRDGRAASHGRRRRTRRSQARCSRGPLHVSTSATTRASSASVHRLGRSRAPFHVKRRTSGARTPWRRSPRARTAPGAEPVDVWFHVKQAAPSRLRDAADAEPARSARRPHRGPTRRPRT